MKNIKFRGKRIDNGKWVEGGFAIIPAPMTCFESDKKQLDKACIVAENERYVADWNMPRQMGMYEVDPSTVGQYTGLKDKNGNEIYEGDITKLILPGVEIRYFEVATRTVTREVVSHPDFDDETAKVRISGVVFIWNGFELFPCVGENGIADSSKMLIEGNIHDVPELLECEVRK